MCSCLCMWFMELNSASLGFGFGEGRFPMELVCGSLLKVVVCCLERGGRVDADLVAIGWEGRWHWKFS